ncbi:tetratricopeptide repeat protein [Ornithinibacillus halotolerans]|uniref:Tetratricopeptide repeat protein n=1 Tax=Ornithinibacillus halotolerans TaxID=1274357 RepID=A0A916S119_9BACI|nr:tetratricopeptide repeat protein [Ornithinibacillus halotolerans]GGA79692.1 hypothetical protein GCM10008025_23880 [Ornithinibacillus halotolerans]
MEVNVNEQRLEAKDLNQQSVLLIQAGNFPAAQKKLDRAIELDPMLVDNYKNYGDLYMASNNFKEAKNQYKKALLIEKSGELYFLYGNACFMNDNVHEGLENYNLALSNGYDNDEALFFVGMAYEHLNDDQMALRYFQKAHLKNPARPDYLVKKISVLVRLDMIDSAEESVDELLKSSPELFDGYHLKTQLLIHKGKIEEAVAFSKAASDRFPEDPELMHDYVKSVALNGQFDLAYQLIHTAKQMKYYDEAKRGFVLLEAQIAAEKQDVDQAIASCKECISLEDEDSFEGEARFMLMNMYLAKEEYNEALEVATALINNKGKDSYYYAALYYRPFCLKQIGKQEEANKLYKEANSIYRLATLQDPAAVDIYLYRVMCLKDSEEYDKALDLLDFISGINQEIAEVHTLRADIYRSQGKAALMKEELNRAFQLKPELEEMYEGVGG